MLLSKFNLYAMMSLLHPCFSFLPKFLDLVKYKIQWYNQYKKYLPCVLHLIIIVWFYTCKYGLHKQKYGILTKNVFRRIINFRFK